MSFRSFVYSLLMFVCSGTVARAQTSTNPNEGLQLGRDSTTGVYTSSWWGRAGRTYFIQQSDDLRTWTYLPVIESGGNQVIQWNFTSNQPRFFERLKFADIPTNSPFDDDFDDDKVSNWDELLQGTDPLVASMDANGLPLDWELHFGIAPGTNPNGVAPRGDGLTYLQAFQQGLNPNSSEGEYLPFLTVVDGSNQAGSPGTILPVPLSVQVSSPRRYTALVTFTVVTGTALLNTSSSSDNPSSTVTVQATPWMYQDGTTIYVARVYVYLPVPSERISTINVTAPSGTQITTISTQEFAFDPNVPPPSGFGVDRVDATTADLSWTPADTTLPTSVEASYDYGYSWAGLTSFNPGVTKGTIHHLRPDQSISLRLYTGSSNGGGGSNNTNAVTASNNANGGGGSTPCDPISFVPLSAPVVIGAQGRIYARNYTYPGFQTPSNRYLQAQIKSTIPDYDPDIVDFPIMTAFYDWLMLFKPDGLGGFTSGWWMYGRPIENFSDNGDNSGTTVDGFVVVSDTEANHGVLQYYDYYNPNAETYHWMYNYTLSRPYNSLSQFVQDVKGQVPPAYFNTFHSPCDITAAISLKEDNTPSHGPVDIPLWNHLTPECDHRYIIKKLEYKFECNRDMNGIVVYDIVFTPDDGGNPIHDVHFLPTNGKTLVPDNPITLDPTQLNNKKNGTYQVVPIALQPDDWTDSDDESQQISTQAVYTTAVYTTEGLDPDDPGQTGVKGAMVPSTQGASGAKHFVSPKKAGDFVWLRGQIPKPSKFEDIYEWVPGQAANGIDYQLDQAHPNKIGVPRDSVGKFPVRYRGKNAGAVVNDPFNVWIVSTTFTAYNSPSDTSAIDGRKLGVISGRGILHAPDGSSLGRGYLPRVDIDWKATIQPSTIITVSDRPAIEKQTRVAPPGDDKGVPSSTQADASSSTFSGWDISRQRETQVSIGSSLTPTDATAGAYQPVAFPTSEVEGNDDHEVSDEDSNPYIADNGAVGHIISTDNPNFGHQDAGDALQQGGAGVDGDQMQFKTKFREFARVQIGDKWYRCSEGNDGLWRFFSK